MRVGYLKVVGAGVLALLILMCAPVGVTAKKHHKKKAGNPSGFAISTKMIPGQTTTATASCTYPRKKNVIVGGGFESTDADGNARGPVSSHMVGKTWVVTWAQPPTGPAGGEVNAFAYCRVRGTRPTQVTATGSVPGGLATQTADVTATCPRGRFAVGGGFDMSGALPGQQAIPVASVLDSASNGWRVSAANSGPEARAFTAYAYCAKKRPVTIGGTTQTPPGNNVGAYGATKCPKKTYSVFGGFDLGKPDFALNGNATTILQSFSNQQFNGWTNVSRHFGDGGSIGTMSTFAYCNR